MRLTEKKLVMLVTDGVDFAECQQLKHGFESEGATILYTTPGEYLMVETVQEGRKGKDILIDLPLEAVNSQYFDGLIIPDGFLAASELKKERRVLELVFTFHQQGLPIFASGKAVEVLYESHVLSEQIVVREGTSIEVFVNHAVEVLLDCSGSMQKYRPSILG